MYCCKNCPHWEYETDKIELKRNEGFCKLYDIITFENDRCTSRNIHTPSLMFMTLIKQEDNFIIEKYNSVKDISIKIELDKSEAEKFYEMLKNEFEE